MARAYLSFIYILGSFSILSCHHASTEKEEEETAPKSTANFRDDHLCKQRTAY